MISTSLDNRANKQPAVASACRKNSKQWRLTDPLKPRFDGSAPVSGHADTMVVNLSSADVPQPIRNDPLKQRTKFLPRIKSHIRIQLAHSPPQIGL